MNEQGAWRGNHKRSAKGYKDKMKNKLPVKNTLYQSAGKPAARQCGNVLYPPCRLMKGVFDSVIIRKGRLYLSHRYNWQHAPELFPDWQFKVIAGVVRGRFDFALVDAGRVIDIDKLDWMKV